MKKEIKLMEMVIILWLNDVIGIDDRKKFLGYLQNRLDREKKKGVKKNEWNIYPHFKMS